MANIDLTNDGKNEHIFRLGSSNEFLFADSGMKHFSRVKLTGITQGVQHTEIVEKIGE